MAQDVHAFIRRKIAGLDAKIAASLPILYGGSVKASNAAELFGMADIDGGLVGGASLVAQDLAKWPWPDPENVSSGPYLFGSEGNRLFPKLPTAPDEAIAWFAANGAKLKWNGSQWLLPIPQR